MAPNSMSDAGPSGCVVKTKKEEGKKIKGISRKNEIEFEKNRKVTKIIQIEKLIKVGNIEQIVQVKSSRKRFKVILMRNGKIAIMKSKLTSSFSLVRYLLKFIAKFQEASGNNR